MWRDDIYARAIFKYGYYAKIKRQMEYIYATLYIYIFYKSQNRAG